MNDAALRLRRAAAYGRFYKFAETAAAGTSARKLHELSAARRMRRAFAGMSAASPDFPKREALSRERAELLQNHSRGSELWSLIAALLSNKN